MDDSLTRLHASIAAMRGKDPASSRTARLLHQGRAKVAKKLAEEAMETALAAVQHDREAVVLESADLLYNLCALWAVSEIRPAEILAEIARRERLYGIAEKLPKAAAMLQKARMKGPGDVLIRVVKR